MRDKPIAKLMWDGESLRIPAELGNPSDGQLIGTIGERLAEVAGRTCYDSFGKGRDSVSYHQHILDVGHLSVHEHYNITFDLQPIDFEERSSILRQLISRPGVWYEKDRITLNPRVVLDWFELKPRSPDRAHWFYGVLRASMHPFLPNVIENAPTDIDPLTHVDPIEPEEMWVSMFMGGSRGFSHEQVRHGDFSAISQRSTRYVDESESNWIWHPLLKQYIEETNDTWLAGDLASSVEMPARAMYKEISSRVSVWLKEKGIDNLTARKQARGAARGFLGNALYTEMIFSASVAQWKRMIEQRAHPAADAEIRELYEKHVIPELQCSRYGDHFS